MELDNSNHISNTLIIGPSSKRKGGIAAVIKMYQKYIGADYFFSTDFQSTLLTFLFFPIKLFFLVIKLFNNKKIQLVHIHGSSEGSFYRKYIIFLIVKAYNKKIIYHLHSGRFEKFYYNSNSFIKRRIRKVINEVDCVIILSLPQKKFIQIEFEPKKVEILGNIITPVKQPRPKLNTENNKIKFLFLGKIFKQKGIYELLDCIVEDYEFFSSKSEFYIAGSGDEKKMKTYKNLDTKKLINFIGWVDEKQKKVLLDKVDILILPSYSEGLPVSIIEAMSHGCAVIATKVGGIPQLLKNDINGKLIKPKSKESIKNAILFYIENPLYIDTHGKAGYLISKDFFPNNIRERLNNIYKEIL